MPPAQAVLLGCVGSRGNPARVPAQKIWGWHRRNSDQLLVRAGGHQRPSCSFSCAFMIFEHFVPLAVVEHPASGSLWMPGASWDLPKVGLADGQRSFTSQKGKLQMVTVVETVSRVITVQTTQTREVQTTRERKPGPVWGRRARSWENTLIHFFPVSAAEIDRRMGSVWGCCPQHVEMLSPVLP